MVRRGTHLALAAACAVAISLLAATGALASAFSDTFADYKAHGNVNACTHSEADLKKAKSQVPPDITQYAPDFPAALNVALEERARGACGAGGTGGASGAAAGAASCHGRRHATVRRPPPPTRTPRPPPPRSPPPRPTARSRRRSTPSARRASPMPPPRC